MKAKPAIINRKRLEIGHSFLSLAVAAGISPSTVNNVCKFERKVHPKTAKVISDALGASIQELFSIE